MNCRVAHDALLDVAALRLELRLDQRHQGGARLEQMSDRRQHKFQRNEADIDGGKIRPLEKSRGIEFAYVSFFHRDDLGPAAQRSMKLAAADVDRVNAA